MTLKDRVNNISSYFRGMEVTNGVLIVKVQYLDKWGVYPRQDEKIKVAPTEDSINEWFYYGDFSEISLNDVFDLIDSTIEMNINAAAKLELLGEKFEELKQIFASENLEVLRTLKFTFEEIKPTKKKRTYKKKNKKNDENTVVAEQSENIENITNEIENNENEQ